MNLNELSWFPNIKSVLIQLSTGISSTALAECWLSKRHVVSIKKGTLSDDNFGMQFLALLNFHRCFILNCTAFIHSPIDLFKGSKSPSRPLSWNMDAQQAFMAARQSLADVVPLWYLQKDTHTRIMVDTSEVTLGAVLQQSVRSVWAPVAFFSKKLAPPRDPVQHIRSRVVGCLCCDVSLLIFPGKVGVLSLSTK